MSVRPNRLIQLCAAGLAMWVVVATGLWALRGPSSGDVLVVAVSCVLALMAGLWWVSGQFQRRSTALPVLAGFHSVAGLLFGSAMVFVTYSIEAAVTGTTVGSVARGARFLGAEFAFWIWLYAVLAASAHGIRVRSALRDARERVTRADARLAEARLAVLRGQLNPHFLFNALHSARALIARSPEDAGRALDRLGDLLRYSLADAGNSTVALSDEIAFTRAYLDLVALSMGDRLRASVVVADDSTHVQVPPFALQTLAENAVRHGLATLPDGGELTVTTRRQGADVELVVVNDGAATERPADSNGGGLANLSERLEALYPGRATLETMHRADGGFVARIVVPGS